MSGNTAESHILLLISYTAILDKATATAKFMIKPGSSSVTIGRSD